MDCDPGTFSDEYTCQQGQCIPVSTFSKKGQYKNVTDCRAACSQ